MSEEPENNSDNLERTEEEKRGGKGLAIYILIFIICALAYNLIKYFENPQDQVLWNLDGSLTLIEAKYFWGGSWFERDHLEVSNNGFSIQKYSLINSKDPDIVNIPFNKTKKVIFIEGNGIYEIDIFHEGNFFDNKENFYMRDPLSFIAVTDNIRLISKNQITINEKKTFIKKLTDWIRS